MPMGSIDRYVFRTILSAFVLILLSLTAVIWTTQILQRIDIITNQGQTTLAFLGITGRLVPILMLVIAPIAIVIAVCYALNKLNGDSELVVMNSAGMAPRRIYRPVLGACVLVGAFVAFISAYFAPLMQRQMNNEVAKIRTDVVANLVRPGAFTSVERGLIFHIRDRIGETQFRGIFIDDNRNSEEHTTIVAEYGQIVQRPEGTFLVMRDGNIERRRPKSAIPPSWCSSNMRSTSPASRRRRRASSACVKCTFGSCCFLRPTMRRCATRQGSSASSCTNGCLRRSILWRSG